MATKRTGKGSDIYTPVMHLILNCSLILMATMTEGFSKLTANMTIAMAGTLGAKVSQDKSKSMSEDIQKNTAKMISELRAKAESQLEQKRSQFEHLLSDPVFKEGLRIASKYKFNLPSLTEKLDNPTLAAYALLLKREDPQFTRMFRELMDWQATLPQPK